MSDAREIAMMRKEIAALKTALAHIVIDGRVAEVDGSRVRLELEPASDGGEPFLSPWVRVQEEAGNGVGGFSSYTERQTGQPMRLLSPGGVIGPASVAMDVGHTDDNPSPGEGKAKVWKHGDATITMSPGKITLAVGGCRVDITGDEIVTHGKTRLNDGSKKVHRVDDLDSAFDQAVGGADDVFA
jgi:hypothetical protein